MHRTILLFVQESSCIVLSCESYISSYLRLDICIKECMCLLGYFGAIIINVIILAVLLLMYLYDP